MGRGAFIVLEGLDRAGKSTQVKKLVEAMTARGTTASSQNFPDRSTDIGKVIDTYLKGGSQIDDAAIHLLFSANRWELAKSIRTRLENGETIVADRYAFSGVAFTAAKGKLSLDWCKSPDKGLPCPDVIVYLDVSPEVAKQRGEFGSERYETPEFQEEVRRKFDVLRYEDLRRWEMVDASKSVDEVAAIVDGIAMRTIAQVQLLPVKDLWVDEDVPAVAMGFADFR